MSNPKGLKWRRTSMAANLSETDIAKRDITYLEWLATDRGWLLERQPCQHCSGAGSRYSDLPVPDVATARAYVDDQRKGLEARAQAAVDSIKHRLFWHGFRPVVTGSHEIAGNTETEYQCREDLRDHISAAHTAAWEAANEARQTWYDAAGQPGCDWNTDRDEYYEAVRAAEHHAEQLRGAIWRLGTAHRDCWAIPGTDAAIYVGTHNQRRVYDRVEAAHSIVIKPGRAPSEYELDLLTEEAIAAIGDDALPLAA